MASVSVVVVGAECASVAPNASSPDKNKVFLNTSTSEGAFKT